MDYERNKRELLMLFRRLDWKEQCIAIGRMEEMVAWHERNQVHMTSPKCKVINFAGATERSFT